MVLFSFCDTSAVMRKSGTAVFLLLCVAATAQQPRTPPTSATTIPSFTIRLSRDTRVFLPYRDNFPVLMKQCDSSGNPYLWLLGPDGIQIAGFLPDAIVTFGKHQITDIPDPSFGNFVVGASGTYILVNAVENAREEKSTYYDEKSHKEVPLTRKVGDRRQYIGRFARDGSYKGAVGLDPHFRVQQLAVFASGNFLAAGVDDNKVPRIALISASGVIQKFVDLGTDLADKPEAAQKAFNKATGVESDVDALALFTQIYSHGDRVLVVRALTGRPVFEVGDGGAVRAVKVKASGQSGVDHMIPSDANWLVDFAALKSGEDLSDREHTLFEVDPETGAVLAAYRIGPSESRISLSCWYAGSFTAIEQRDGRIIRLHGSAEPDKPSSPAE